MHIIVRRTGTYNFLMHQASAFKLKFYRWWCTKYNLLLSRAPLSRTRFIPMAKQESESTYICIDNTRISEKTFLVPLGFGGYLLTCCSYYVYLLKFVKRNVLKRNFRRKVYVYVWLYGAYAFGFRSKWSGVRSRVSPLGFQRLDSYLLLPSPEMTGILLYWRFIISTTKPNQPS